MKIYFAPMEGITDDVMRRAHREVFGGVNIYGLPYGATTRRERPAWAPPSSCIVWATASPIPAAAWPFPWSRCTM